LTDANAHAELFAEPTARIAALEAKTDSENNWKTITGYSLNPATRVLTMDAGWEGIINGIEYTNVAAQEMLPAIPLANSGYSRIDLIVFKTDGTFERISGVESTFTPVAPPKPAYTLEATFLTVGDGVVNAPVIPKPKAPVTSVQGMRGDVILNVINDLVTGGIYDFLSAEQGKVLKTQIDNINILLASDNVNLDNVQELVDAIETVQLSLSTILVNDLTTGGTTKALTAEMGKTLKGLIDGLVVPMATDTVRGIVKIDVPTADPVVYLKETVDTLLHAKANYFLGIKPITGITYNVIMGATVEDGDILKQLVYDGTLPMNVIIPNNATVPFPIGTIFYTVGTNTGVLSISGGAGVVFQTSVGLSAAQNEVRKYTKRGINTWGVEGGVSTASVVSALAYKTYFVNSTTGNNTTGLYQDSSKPFATLDYVLALIGANDNVRIWLQDSGTYALNGTIPSNKSIEFYSDTTSTLTLAGNTTVGAITANSFLKFNIPNGTILFTAPGSGAADTVWFYMQFGKLEINCSFLTVGNNFYVNRCAGLNLIVKDTLNISGTFIYWLWLTINSPIEKAEIYIAKITSTTPSSFISYTLSANSDTVINMTVNSIISTSSFTLLPYNQVIVNLTLGAIVTVSSAIQSFFITPGQFGYVTFKNTVVTGLVRFGGNGGNFTGNLTINSNTGWLFSPDSLIGGVTFNNLLLFYNGSDGGVFRYLTGTRFILIDSTVVISTAGVYFALKHGGSSLDFTGMPAIFTFYGANQIKHITNNFELVYLQAGSNYPLFEVYGTLKTNGLMQSNPSTTMTITNKTSNAY
jgi:hypothetical protein